MGDKVFPATQTVHWPNGPIAACDKHASQALGLAALMGWHVVASEGAPGAQCANCIREAVLPQPDQESK